MIQLLDHAFRASAVGEESAVLFIDLDRFKEVNDTYGHRVGDELSSHGHRLTGFLRPGDSLARLSGDEFVILCEDLGDPSAADPLTAGSAGAGTPVRVLEVAVTVTASMGTAFTGEGHDPRRISCETPIGRCTELSARATGTTTSWTGASCISPGTSRARRLDLPGAIEREQLHLEYQPIVGAGNGSSRARKHCCGGRIRRAGKCPQRCSSRSPSSQDR